MEKTITCVDLGSERKLAEKRTLSSRAFPRPAEARPTIGHQDLLSELKEGCGFSFTLTRRGTRQAQVNGRP
ncbi:hypothetical protein ACUM5Y_04525 [Marinomonas dokdonensis]|uniref:hypothetical protein n=1 Tax=Marinomonas dokdonensis TaxID=328224 RepID=UPI0040554666